MKYPKYYDDQQKQYDGYSECGTLEEMQEIIKNLKEEV